MVTTERAETRIGRRRERRRDRDRGQTAIEFVGVTPLIILMLIALWQCALFGYTFILAGNAADVAARAGNGSQHNPKGACEQAGRKDLPSAWQGKAHIGCPIGYEPGLYKVRVDLTVPVLVPGVLDWGPKVHGDAASAKEG
ncbi:TadE family protein [Streptomyces sp. OR43]|uniref:TadE family protein n=1 Tax=Streptomyces sp. or43 TaxID=2478957 RepID=UPI0011CE4EE8|nr:TadE family protein [Streptomyces sp. or43]TXS37759.1 pilus assembly protein [Streptomyces sp. or43]